MADRVVYTLEAARAGASLIALSIADPDADPTPTVGKIRLFDETVSVDQDTTRATLIAAELSGASYPAGGYEISAFSSPTNEPLGGVVITSNVVHVEYTSGDPLLCGGYWVDDHTAVTPQCREVVVYDPPRPLASIGQGWPIVIQMSYGRNA